MTSSWSETVLVLRVGVVREADCWVRFFSPSHGLMSAFAFGGRRSRRRFGGCLDPLDQVHFAVAWDRRRRYLVLQEGSLVERFGRLKTDLHRLGQACNLVRFGERLVVAPENAPFVYGALVEALRLLDSPVTPSRLFPVLFRAHLVFGLGFAPRLDRCGRCGGPPGLYPAFSVAQGMVLCPRCAEGQRRICAQTLAVLRSLSEPLPAPWATQALAPAVREELWYVVDHFLRWHVELRATETRQG